MSQQSRYKVVLTILATIFLLALTPCVTWSQAGNTGSITVTVLDPSGSVVPDASLELRDLATNDIRKAVTQGVGNYKFTNLPLGTYSLSVSKAGFETQVFNSVQVQASQTTDLKANLRVGAAAQSVQVTAEAVPIVAATTNAIGTTISTQQIENLPLQGRNISDFSRLIPGYSDNGTDRTWNGLPVVAQGNNIDGVISSSSRMKFTGNSNPTVSVRLENIQEMTVSTDAMDLNQGYGQSSMQLNFVTRRGSNNFHGRLFEDHRNAALNANSWTNNARGLKRNPLILNDFGGSVGGPIFKNKLFFFGSFAMSKQPSGNSTTAPIFTSAAQQGNYTYTAGGVSHTVNVLNLAATSGLPSTIHPTIASQLTKINNSRQFGAVTPSDPVFDTLAWTYPNPTTIYYPTVRVDYNTTQNVRMNFSWNETKRHDTNGDRPDFPGPDFTNTAADNNSLNYTVGYGLDWTLSPTLINQFRAGYLYTAAKFGYNAPFSDYGTLPHINWPARFGRSGFSYPLPNSRYFPTVSASDTISRQQGSHALNFGFSFWREQDHYWDPPEGYPIWELGLANGDPARQMFNTTNFPGASGTQLAAARNLYAVLVGRVGVSAPDPSIHGRHGFDAATHNYLSQIGSNTLNELQKSWGVFVQDSWRFRPSLTLNYGLRWDFVGDNYDLNKMYHSAAPADLFGPSGVNNLFSPGSLPGTTNPLLTTRPHPYNAWNVTPQPAFGFAWNPHANNGWLKTLLGGDATVIRGGYSLRRFTEPQQYFWDYATDFGAFYYQNFNLTASGAGVAGGFNPGTIMLGDALPPFLFSPATFLESEPQSDFTFLGGPGVNGMNPNIAQPYTQSWNFGIQRRLGNTRAIEARYNGNRTIHQWIAVNPNEVNIFAARPGQDSFLTQFQHAQQNLAINAANGVANSFRNNGFAGQFATPLFDAAFAGAADADGYGNTDMINWLSQGQAGALANLLAGSGPNANARYFCNLVGASFGPCAANLNYTGPGAGYPINFFQANPFAAGNNTGYMDAAGYSSYHALQLDFRQATWHGLQFDANYTWSKNLGVTTPDDWTGAFSGFTLRDLHMSYLPTGFDRHHVMHVNVTYDLPFGRGRTFANQPGIVDKIVGGWNIGSIVTFQTGSPFRLTSGYNTFNDYGDSGVVLLNGVTRSQLQDAVGLHRVTPAQNGGKRVDFVNMIDPKFMTNVLGTGGANPEFFAPSTTPGQFGQIITLWGPHATFVDMALSKALPITERVRFKFQAEFLNAFNHPTFGNPVDPGAFPPATTSILSDGFGVAHATTCTPQCSPRNIELRANLEF